MPGPVIIDTNLLLLLVVGAADKKYIKMHKRLSSEYTIDDWDLLYYTVGLFGDIVLLPNIVTEVSSFSRQIEDPAYSVIQKKFEYFIDVNLEMYCDSKFGTKRSEFSKLGLTDAVILHALSDEAGDLNLTLLSVDEDLLNAANSLGYNILDFNLLIK